MDPFPNAANIPLVNNPFLFVLFVLISLVSGSFLVRQYRKASTVQRRQIVYATGAAVALAVVALLVLEPV